MRENLFELCSEESLAETSLVHTLSKIIPEGAHIFLGNSLPIREWDLAATLEQRNYRISVNRGMNGIDGQLSTFFGLSDLTAENWVIIGDLTALYDLAAPWIINQLNRYKFNIVIINNGGAKIFAKLFSEPELQNTHNFNYKGFAEQWGLHYEKLTALDTVSSTSSSRLIELVPCAASTTRFNHLLARVQGSLLCK